MTDQELEQYVDNARVINLVSNGPGGYPHPMPMFFDRAKDGVIEMTTYGTSQKVKNMERDPRVALMVESGAKYEELKGAILYCTAEIIRDQERTFEFMSRRAGTLTGAEREAVLKQSQKRVLLRFHVNRVVSWDHSKLGGVY